MKILCLYNNDTALELFEWMVSEGHETVLIKDELDADWCREQGFELAVSYTYRHILTEEILEALGYNVVNLHISYLPWNKGADPNLWSILENTPRGATLHYMDARLDHGDIIAQKLLPLHQAYTDDEPEATLASTYAELDVAAKQLFKDAFAYYSFWNKMRKKVTDDGTYHRASDANAIKQSIGTYDICISDVMRIINKENLYSQ